ncbi:MAG: sec-independent translocase [Jatrophihabitantaceae bacterium]
MFNVGPMEMVVLAIVGIIVVGPDKLPGLAKDAARMLRTLRDMAQGARTQLRDELGPEFADVDLSNLNPRTALKRAVLGDEELNFNKLSPRTFLQDAVSMDEAQPAPVSMAKPQEPPLGRDEQAPYDTDAT